MLRGTFVYPRLGQKPNILACIALFLILSSVAFSFLGMFSEIRTTVGYELPWNAAFYTVLLVVCISLAVVLYTARSRVHFSGGLKSALLFIVGSVIGFGFLVYGAVYSGIPIALHHITSAPGEMVVTVAGKKSNYRKRACTPRLEIEEFSVSKKEYLCVNESAFSQIQIGSKIRLKGKVSSYGVEVEELFW